MSLLGAIAQKFKSFGLSDTVRLVSSFRNSAMMPISTERAMQISTVFACVRLLSETVGTLPMQMFEREDDIGKHLARDHYLYPLLHDSPNADLTAVEYWERVVADLCLNGNHFSEKVYAGNKIIALNPLFPDLMEVGRSTDGSIYYYYADPYQGWREIPERNMFHIRGFGTTGSDVVGLSPISYARVSLNIAVATEDAAANNFRNGMRPSAVLETERTLTKEQRAETKGWLEGMARGPENAGNIIVLESGFAYRQMSLNPVDAQMLENRAFNVEDICRWFRVPPFMLGHTEKSTSWGTGLEQQNIAFASYSLRPYLSRIESAIRKFLFTPAERLKYVAEFNMEALLRGDSGARAQVYGEGIRSGWMSPNEARAKENMAPSPHGDVLMVQAQMIPLAQIGLQGVQNNNGV